MANLDRRLLLRSPLILGGALAWQAHADTRAPGKPIVLVMLRGAVDGLSIVVPTAEVNYAQMRPGLVIAPPGQADGALDLGLREFALHPALSMMLPYWQRQQLAFVHASGSPDPTRSHFDAQDTMETGTPGRKNTANGWMARLLSVTSVSDQAPDPLRAMQVGPVMPRVLAGYEHASSVPNATQASRQLPTDRGDLDSALRALYADDPAGREALARARDSRAAVRSVSMQAQAELMQAGSDAVAGDPAANRGAAAAQTFVDDARHLGSVMRRDARVQVGVMSVGGWDTHANQGNVRGQLANRLAGLGQGLAALASSLGPRFSDSLIIVMSEFGRTLRQNGAGGTDHGRGNVMWLLGGQVQGGSVHGAWPGLDQSALADGRDLAVVNDFRAVLAASLGPHLGLSERQLADIFPVPNGTRGFELFRPLVRQA